jgi:hypothetical protein
MTQQFITAQQYYTVEDVVTITVTGQTVIDVNCKETITGAGDSR